MKKFTILLIFSLIIMGNSVHSFSVESSGHMDKVCNAGTELALGTTVCTAVFQAVSYATGIPVDLETSAAACAFLTAVTMRSQDENESSVINPAMTCLASIAFVETGSYVTGTSIDPTASVKVCAAVESAFMIAARASKK